MGGRKMLLALVVSFFVLGFVVYVPSLGNDFVDWDDQLLITENPVSQSLSLENIWKAFSMYDPELYIPLTFVSYQINAALFGVHPAAFHATNLILHILNALFVVWLTVLLFRSRLYGVLVGLLFLVHPLHTEAIAWASARKDVLASFFFLLTLIWYLRFTRTHAKKQLFTSYVLCFLGFLSKVSLVVLPFVVLLIDWFEGRRMTKDSLLQKAPYFLLAIIFTIVAVNAKITTAALYFEKALIAFKASVFYLWKLLLPTGLSVLYPYTDPISIFTWDILLSIIIFILITVFVIWIYRKGNKFPLFAWAFYCLALLPSFNTLAKGHDELLDVYFASDRYAYLASIPFLMLLGLLVMYGREKYRQLTIGLFVCVLAVFSFLSYKQSMTWKSTEALFTNVSKHYLNAHVAHTTLGAIAFEGGDEEEAIRRFEMSLAVRENGLAYYNIGQIYFARGQLEKAIEVFQKSVQLDKTDPDSRLYLGALLLQIGRPSEAVDVLRSALKLTDQVPQIYRHLGMGYAQLGQYDQAIASYERVLELRPENAAFKEEFEELKRLSE